MFSVSVLEAKTIIRAIDKTYGTDLSGLSMASFRLRLSEMIRVNGIPDTDSLVGKLLEDSSFYESFIRDISIGSPDMFRDPDFWIYFRDQLLPSILEIKRWPEFIIPESVTGNELYSLAVMLREAKQDHRIDLAITCRNRLIRDRIMDGELPYQRFKNSRDNYQVFNPGASFEQYTELRASRRYLKQEMLQGVEFRVEAPGKPLCSEKTALVLYRNRMIYQNPETQYSNLKKLLSNMKEGTYLVTGIQEAIEGFGLEHLYKTISSDLKIYQKLE